MEAGLRSFDRTMPEEINRLLTDQIADMLFTPSKDGDENLLREGVPLEKIHFVGNVMIDTLVCLLPLALERWQNGRLALNGLSGSSETCRNGHHRLWWHIGGNHLYERSLPDGSGDHRTTSDGKPRHKRVGWSRYEVFAQGLPPHYRRPGEASPNTALVGWPCSEPDCRYHLREVFCGH